MSMMMMMNSRASTRPYQVAGTEARGFGCKNAENLERGEPRRSLARASTQPLLCLSAFLPSLLV